ncbi:MAG TPA: ABC transporter substrate-binding protein, partial [Burkholderiales bacterium]|nr:ABC transporter substrate-binding protein [Burkholderiales bacterium]
MTDVTKLYDADIDLSAPCSCGKHRSKREHDAKYRRDAQTISDAETLGRNAVESAMVRALFPDDRARRRFLKAVGANTAMAAIASVLPIGAMQVLAQDKRPLEKKELKIGFIPITCATPLILAHPLRYYAAEGLNVEVIKTAGWALIRDKVLNKEYDASHMLAPMPIAISMGIGSSAQAMNVATIQNINGQAITLAIKHKDKRDPKTWK